MAVSVLVYIIYVYVNKSYKCVLKHLKLADVFENMRSVHGMSSKVEM